MFLVRTVCISFQGHKTFILAKLIDKTQNRMDKQLFDYTSAPNLYQLEDKSSYKLYFRLIDFQFKGDYMYKGLNVKLIELTEKFTQIHVPSFPSFQNF